MIGTILWAALAWIGLTRRIDGFPRITVPGTAAVHVSDTSTRVLYYGTARGITPIPGTAVRVTDAAGHAVPVSSGYDVRYDVPATWAVLAAQWQRSVIGAGLVLIVGAGGGLTLIVVTATRRASHRARAA